MASNAGGGGWCRHRRWLKVVAVFVTLMVGGGRCRRIGGGRCCHCCLGWSWVVVVVEVVTVVVVVVGITAVHDGRRHLVRQCRWQGGEGGGGSSTQGTYVVSKT